MLKRISSFVLVCSCLMVGFSSSASAERYVVRTYRTPVVVARPVVVAVPVAAVQVVPRRRVVRVGYYTPAPVVVTPRRVVVTPTLIAPVVVTPAVVTPVTIAVSPRRRVHEVVRGNANRSVTRVREYRPHGIFATAKHKVIERDTRRGVVVRQRGR